MSTNENTIVQSILKHGPDILNFIENSEYIDSYVKLVSAEKLNYPLPDNYKYGDWLIPNEYLTLDIESYLVEKCPDENKERLIKELELYRKYDMINVLRSMKYIVDILRNNDIVWGVGRGSSVASYALFLLGVHKIDSVKYDLPLDEFFKGEK
jgi:DNA polymerase III alpha subunit